MVLPMLGVYITKADNLSNSLRCSVTIASLFETIVTLHFITDMRIGVTETRNYQ